MIVSKYVLEILSNEELIAKLLRSCLADINKAILDFDSRRQALQCKQGKIGAKMRLVNVLYNVRRILDDTSLRNHSYPYSEHDGHISNTDEKLLISQTLCELSEAVYNIRLIYNKDYMGLTLEDTTSDVYREKLTTFKGYYIK